jgi:glycosyltransferase involved in cell wall biosynthesis
MKIALVGPISLKMLQPYLQNAENIPEGYGYPLAAYYVLELLAKGHEVAVVTNSWDCQENQYYKGEKLTVHLFPRRRLDKMMLTFYRQERNDCIKAIKILNPDIVHANWTYEFAWAAIDSGFPYIVTARDDPWQILRTMPSVYRFYRLICGYLIIPRIRNMAVNSPYLEKQVTKHYFFKGKSYVVPNGLNQNMNYRERDIKCKQNIIIGTVTGWNTRKNPKVTLKAFKKVKEKIPNAQLLMVGTNCQSGSVAEEWAIKNHCQDGVQFMGALSNKDTINILHNEVDVFVHTTREESFGMSILEAMAQALPIVAGKNSGAIPWLLDYGNAGILTDINDEDSVADSIFKLCSDSGLSKVLGRKAFERVKCLFSMKMMTNRYLEVYNEIVT